MRTEKEVLDLVVSIALAKEEVIAVLLAGSRTNEKVKSDKYQDYDVTYVVEDVDACVNDPEWMKAFGEPILLQTPDDMMVPEDSSEKSDENEKFAYLMLFQDYVRIDLTLVELSSADKYTDSLSKIILDKGNFLNVKHSTPSDRDYLVRKPTRKEFTDCCNEFWWVSTYVIKGLLRKNVLYAKHILEKPLRNMLLLMLSWYVGYQHGYKINVGSEYKYLDVYLDKAEWMELQKSYPDLNLKNILSSLQVMIALFENIESYLAEKLHYEYNKTDIDHVKSYMEFHKTELFFTK